MTLYKPVTLSLICILLGACVASEAVRAPEQLDAAQWSTYLLESNLPGRPVSRDDWWRQFDDQRLNGLIDRVLLNNLDLKIARSRIREARAHRRIELAPLQPQLNVGGQVTDQRLSENGSLPVGEVPGFEVEQTIYEAGFDAAWELDLFGRNSRRRLVARSRFEDEQERQQDLHLSIIAEFAVNYFDLLGTQAQTRSMQAMIQRQQRIVDVTLKRQNLGDASQLEVDQAQAALAEVRAQLPAMVAQERGLIYRLSILVGLPPEELSAELSSPKPLPNVSNVGLAGATSALLRRRADVRNAERQYLIAIKQEELAKLAIYPTFTLFADGGPNTTDFDNFSDSESLALNLAGLIDWPLYTGGRLAAEKNIAEERVIQAEFAYVNTVLKALEEIEATAASFVEAASEVKLRRTLYQARRRLADNSGTRYRAGVDNLTLWLSAEQDSATSLQQLIAIQTQWLRHNVAMHKALGGGWESVEKLLENQQQSDVLGSE